MAFFAVAAPYIISAAISFGGALLGNELAKSQTEKNIEAQEAEDAKNLEFQKKKDVMEDDFSARRMGLSRDSFELDKTKAQQSVGEEQRKLDETASSGLRSLYSRDNAVSGIQRQVDQLGLRG